MEIKVQMITVVRELETLTKKARIEFDNGSVRYKKVANMACVAASLLIVSTMVSEELAWDIEGLIRRYARKMEDDPKQLIAAKVAEELADILIP